MATYTPPPRSACPQNYRAVADVNVIARNTVIQDKDITTSVVCSVVTSVI